MTNKDQILEKSQELFSHFGYKKTTLTDIARAVGKVKTAIYYYFSGKEEIFASLVQLEAEELLQHLQAQVESETTALRKLEVYVAARIAWMQKLSVRYRFLKGEIFELLPLIEGNRQDAHRAEIQLVQETLEVGCKAGEFMVESPLFAANMLVSSLKGLEVQMYVTDQLPVDTLQPSEFTNFLLYGILQPAPVPHSTTSKSTVAS